MIHHFLMFLLLLLAGPAAWSRGLQFSETMHGYGYYDPLKVVIPDIGPRLGTRWWRFRGSLSGQCSAYWPAPPCFLCCAERGQRAGPLLRLGTAG
jgi:hypothetical protein